MPISALARLMRRRANEASNTGVFGRRNSPRSPALPGFARGTMGVTGSVGLKRRNVDAADDKDREELFNEIMARRRRRI